MFDDGFVPSAKITGGGSYSIISDCLGTPVEAYDADGKRVWSAELDIYGRAKEYTGVVDFVPFRYQGRLYFFGLLKTKDIIARYMRKENDIELINLAKDLFPNC